MIFTPIMAVIIAGILFAIFNAALGGEASFKQVLSVLVHAGAVSALSSVLSGTVNYLRGTAMTSVANLGALLPMLPEKSFAANLLGAVDIFLIWYIVVLAIGLGVLYRRRTQPIAISLLSVYAVIALCIALFKSRGGRRMSRNKKILIGARRRRRPGGGRLRQHQVQAAGRHRRQRRGDPEARPPGDRLGLGQDPAADGWSTSAPTRWAA